MAELLLGRRRDSFPYLTMGAFSYIIHRMSGYLFYTDRNKKYIIDETFLNIRAGL